MADRKSIFFLALMIFLQTICLSSITLGSFFFTESKGSLTMTLWEFNTYFLMVVLLVFGFIWGIGKIAERKNNRLFQIGVICNIFALFFLGNAVIAFYRPNWHFFFYFVALFFIGAGTGILFSFIPSSIFDLFSKSPGPMILFFSVLAFGNFFFYNFFIATFDFGQFIFYLIFLAVCFVFVLFFADLNRPFLKKQETGVRLPKTIWLFFFSAFFLAFMEAVAEHWALQFMKTDKTGDLDLNVSYLFFIGAIFIGRLLFGVFFLRYNSKWMMIVFPTLISIFAFLHAVDVFANSYLLLIVLGLLLSIFSPLFFYNALNFFSGFHLKVTSKTFAGSWFGLVLGVLLFINVKISNIFTLKHFLFFEVLGGLGLLICNIIYLNLLSKKEAKQV